MPATESPFVIGVIREKEKSFLETDEYTRLVEAPDVEASRKSLIDTVYGTFIERETTVGAGLKAHLQQEWLWLKEVLDDGHVLQFLGARYDGLNIAGVLLDMRAGRESLRAWSSLGSIPVEMLVELLREGDIEDWEMVPEVWRAFLQEEVARVTTDNWSAGETLTRVKEQVIAVWEHTANSPLMMELTHLWAEHLQHDEAWRKEAGDTEAMEVQRPSFLNEEAVRSLQEETSAVSYELAWDVRMIELLQPAKTMPVGSDPIVAWWIAKELEVKTIRLLLAGKSSGMEVAALRELIRPLYLTGSSSL